tara:strand:+ start:311 stop:544 length:234 start_codon:yes stop_codon:yes gene_type:complete
MARARRDATRRDDVRFRLDSIRFPARADARDRSLVRRARGDDDVETIALDVSRASFETFVGRRRHASVGTTSRDTFR